MAAAATGRQTAAVRGRPGVWDSAAKRKIQHTARTEREALAWRAETLELVQARLSIATVVLPVDDLDYLIGVLDERSGRDIKLMRRLLAARDRRRSGRVRDLVH